MKVRLLLLVVLLGFGRVALATLADDVVISVTDQNAGPTPFLNQLTLSVSNPGALKSITFAIAPRSGSDTRPLTGTYSHDYLAARGNIGASTVFLPIYGLYAGETNSVTLTYLFNDGSSKGEVTEIATEVFDDPCDYENPTVLQAKTPGHSLSYDYLLVKGACSAFSPAIIDTDGALRWVGTANIASFDASFFENAIYLAFGPKLYRNDLDGTVTLLGDFGSNGVVGFHHNVDHGKYGLLLEADTDDYLESVIMEVDRDGKLLQTWNMAEIISAAMIAGGDNPSEFVFPDPGDWFHSNAATYNRADDSLIISSREDFVIALDYATGAIRWILGDPEKAWYQFPSLRQFALALAPGSFPPIGQHAVSIAYDQGLLLFDNGMNGLFFDPPGAARSYAAPRKYQLDLETRTATEVWNYPMEESINSPFCGSVYEDAPLNFLIDYAVETDPSGGALHARLVGLDATGAKIFDYQYPTAGCLKAFNAAPLHLEGTAFPAVGPQSLNLSTRGLVAPDQQVLIGGFIITGTEAKTVVLRALGPSLGSSGVAGVLADPTLNVYDGAGQPVAFNDNWQDGANAEAIAAAGLAPGDSAEAALWVTLNPGAYTAVVTAGEGAPGIGLVEMYDVLLTGSARLANMSTRGQVGLEAEQLIAGFIVGAVESSTVVLRSLGPSLGAAGIDDPLADPSLTVFDENGTALAANDNWRDDPSAFLLAENLLAPPDDAEAATILHLPAGSYTVITAGAGGETGIGLVEVYNLE